MPSNEPNDKPITAYTMAGIELMSAGTWNGVGCPVGGCVFTTQMIDEMVAAARANPNFRVPLKLGHSQRQELLGSLPAAGWVENLRRVGDRLVADLTDVPKAIAQILQAGGWRNRSIEVSYDQQLDGKTYATVLTGLALLGDGLPAVNNLADIVALYESDAKSDTQIIIFSSEEHSFDDILGEFDRVVIQLEGYYKERGGAPDLSGLARAFKNGVRERAGGNRMEIAEMRTLLGLAESATDDEIKTAIATLKITVPTPTVDAAAFAQARTELSAATQRVLTLEQSLARRDAETAVDEAIREGKLLPAQRETSAKFALNDAEGFKAFIAGQPKVVEFGERGSQGSNNTTEFEPTALELSVAKQVGISRERLMFQKYRDAGRSDDIPAAILTAVAAEDKA